MTTTPALKPINASLEFVLDLIQLSVLLIMTVMILEFAIPLLENAPPQRNLMELLVLTSTHVPSTMFAATELALELKELVPL